MPVIEVRLMQGYSGTAKTRLCQALSNAARLVIPAPQEAVTVMVHEIAPDGYMRGGSSRAAAPALPDPSETVRNFLSAMERREMDTAQSVLAEGFTMVFPGTGEMYKLSELVEWARPRYHFVRKSYDGFDALQSDGEAAIVYARGTLSGEWLDGATFQGIRFIDRFEVIEGKLVRQDVWNDMGEVTSKT